MWATADRQQRNVPVRLTASDSSHSARLSSVNGFTRATPAAHTTTSSRPIGPARRPASSASTAASSVTSHVTASARPPATSISSATAPSSVAERAASTTRSPAAAKARATAARCPARRR